MNRKQRKAVKMAKRRASLPELRFRADVFERAMMEHVLTFAVSPQVLRVDILYGIGHVRPQDVWICGADA